MKKIKNDQQQNRLQLHRETLRLLSAGELRRAAGGFPTNTNSDWCSDSDRCSDYGICSTSPELMAK